MRDCTFYHVETRTTPSREVGAVDGMVTISSVPYCTHRHSPCTLLQGRTVVGATRALTCGGSLDKCPLTPDQLAEF